MARIYTSAFICGLVFLAVIPMIIGRSRKSKSSALDSNTAHVSSPSVQHGAKENEPAGVISGSFATTSRRSRNNKRRAKRRPRKNKKRVNKDTNIDSNDILRETMIQLFGFKHMPARSGCNNGDCNAKSSGVSLSQTQEPSRNHSDFKPTPPSFMLELYRTYSEDKDLMILHSKSQGNTVRSFFPSPAAPRHRETDFGQAIVIAPVPESGSHFTPTSVFLFNITLIPGLEDLVAAEIRLDRLDAGSQNEVMVGVYKRGRECDDELDCQGAPYEIFTKVGTTLVLDSVSGTTWSGSKLARLAKRARQDDHVIIVKFVTESARNDNTPVQRMRRHFEKKPELPFSFISQDTPPVRRRRSPMDSSDNMEAAEPLIPIFIAYCNDPRTESDTGSPPAAPAIWKALENITSTTRTKRSLDASDDVLPTDGQLDGAAAVTPVKTKRTRDVSQTNSVTVVDKRKNGSKRRRKKNRNNSQTPRNSTHNALDLHNRRQSKRNRSRGRGNRRQGGKNKARRTEIINIKLHSSLLAEERKRNCRRKSLTVSFADIGWSPWIISPENFEAYYCTGDCDLAQDEGTSMTNHAIIQSVVKKIAGRAELPSPCCVPDKLMSLSVLFFDQDKNVVLKVFPNMSVETCGCR